MLKQELERVFTDSSQLFVDLHKQINEVEMLTPKNPEDVNPENPNHIYFDNNRTFFVKTFLILGCSYLEVYLKEVFVLYINEYAFRLKQARIPNYLLEHKIKKSIDTGNDTLRKQGVLPYHLEFSEKEIDNLISPDIKKTIDAFLVIGIDLGTELNNYKNIKREIEECVKKRNRIVHYNDQASDKTLIDVKSYLISIKNYINIIHNLLIKEIKF